MNTQEQPTSGSGQDEGREARLASARQDLTGVHNEIENGDQSTGAESDTGLSGLSPTEMEEVATQGLKGAVTSITKWPSSPEKPPQGHHPVDARARIPRG